MGLFEDLTNPRLRDLVGRAGIDGEAASEVRVDVLDGPLSLAHTEYADADDSWYEFVGVSEPHDGGEASDNVAVSGEWAPYATADEWLDAVASGELRLGEPLDLVVDPTWSDMGRCSGCGAEGKVGVRHFDDLAGNPFVAYCGEYVR